MVTLEEEGIAAYRQNVRFDVGRKARFESQVFFLIIHCMLWLQQCAYFLCLKTKLKMRQTMVNTIPAEAKSIKMIVSGRATVTISSIGTPSYGMSPSVSKTVNGVYIMLQWTVTYDCVCVRMCVRMIRLLCVVIAIIHRAKDHMHTCSVTKRLTWPHRLFRLTI